MAEYKSILRWTLDDDGGGTALLFEHENVAKKKFVFDSLDELPSELAEAIRKDGGMIGEITHR